MDFTRKIKISAVLLWLVLGIFACQTMGTQGTPLPTTKINASVEPSAPPPTQTQFMVAANSLTATPQATYTVAIPTSTATPRIFSKDEVEANIMQLFMNNSMCEPPCWWGLIPGRTFWDDVKLFLIARGIGTSYFRRAPWDVYSSYYSVDNNQIATYIEFFVRQKIVYGIRIRGNGSGLFPSNLMPFKTIMEDFSPEAIIAKYGPPSKIWLYFGGTTGEAGELASSTADLWLFYEESGFFTYYSGVTENMNDESFYLCPSFSGNQFYDVTAFYSYPESDMPLTEWAQPESQFPLDLEQATGFSVEEFYAQYQQNDGEVCFESPREIWK